MKLAKMILTDQGDKETNIPIQVHSRNGALLIKPEGYGDMCSDDNEGVPVLIEVYDGQLRVVIWDDINQEDTSHIISLEGTREESREDG